MPPRPIKLSIMPKQRPLRLLTFILILLALSHLPSLARENPSLAPTSTSREQITSHLMQNELPSYNLEIRWDPHNFNDRICRIHNACISGKSVVVHPWMKPHIHHLRACGVDNITFSNRLQPSSFLPFDLFGVQPARFHIPHFLTDILPMIYSSKLLTQPSSQVEAVCETPNRARCRSSRVIPALQVEERAMKQPSDSWVKQLGAILPGAPRLILPEDACFRSIIAYRKDIFKQGRKWYSHGELFEKGHINRATVLGSCSPHVVILNRAGWERRGGIFLGRDIVNVDQVVKQISETAPKYRLNVTVEVAYFENRTFTEQIRIMQRADAIIGVHGAGLANLLFAKMDVPVLEVVPFGYYAGPFDRLAKALYLNFSRIVAKPDNESFMDCLKKRANKPELEQEFEEDADTWKSALEAWKTSGNDNVLQTQSLTSQRNSSMKVCARGQRFTIDPSKTAHKLLKMAAMVCRGDVQG